MRQAEVSRRTSETDIEVRFCLDGSGDFKGGTGIGFFDHMLEAFARHGFFDLEVKCKGDLEVDGHHTVEDVGLCIGEALDRALGDRSGIARFGEAYAPMDEALARAVVDISGRPLLVWGVQIGREKVGEFETELAPEFFRALTSKGNVTVHIDLLRGENAHHSLEAVFKAFGRALDRATRREERAQGPPSTKGRI